MTKYHDTTGFFRASNKKELGIEHKFRDQTGIDNSKNIQMSDNCPTRSIIRRTRGCSKPALSLSKENAKRLWE